MVRNYAPNVEPIPGYRIIRFLGRGGFGEVWEVEAPGGLRKAIKIASMETDDEGECRELEGLQKVRKIRHPYLLSIERYDLIENDLVIIMELADKNLADRFEECLAEKKRGIPRDELLRYIHEAAEVLDLMHHEHGVQHLDIKPENLFLSSGHVKVGDFGLVKPHNTSISQKAMAISPPYAPLELFDGRVEPTADQYSLAVTYQELLTGRRPYDAADIRGLIYQHLRGKHDLSSLPPGDRPVIAQALNRDPNLRFKSCMELADALRRAVVFATPTFDRRPAATSAAPTSSLVNDKTAVVARTDIATAVVAAADVATADIAAAALTPVTAPTPINLTPGGGSKTVQPSFAARGSEKEIGAKIERLEQPISAGHDVAPAGDLGFFSDADVTRSTFVAFLPIGIFAHKLRGFMDSFNAELLTCTDDRVQLRIGPKGWFGRRGNGYMIAMETFSHNPNAGYRVVNVEVKSDVRQREAHEIGRRETLIINCLKAYLMASDANPALLARSERAVRAEIFK